MSERGLLAYWAIGLRPLAMGIVESTGAGQGFARPPRPAERSQRTRLFFLSPLGDGRRDWAEVIYFQAGKERSLGRDAFGRCLSLSAIRGSDSSGRSDQIGPVLAEGVTFLLLIAAGR
jgi:hypothetical protein